MFLLWQTHSTPDAANRKKLHNGTLLPGILHFNLRKAGYYDRVTWRRIQSEAQYLSETRQEGRRFLSLTIASAFGNEQFKTVSPNESERHAKLPNTLPLTSQTSLLQGGCKRKSGRRETSILCDTQCSTSYLIKIASPLPRSSWGQLK